MASKHSLLPNSKKLLDGMKGSGIHTLEGIDFSKPKKYIKEVVEFLQTVTIVNELNLQGGMTTLNGNDAK